MLVVGMTTTNCLFAKEKKARQMAILFVKGENNDIYAQMKPRLAPGVYEEAQTKRHEAFRTLLGKYFKQVRMMDVKEYTPDVSYQYDVTIFDGTPTGVGKLPMDFSVPCITIGEVSSSIGRTLGLKNDWFCLCLDAHAHHLNTDHPIFKGPFKTKLTYEERPTPGEAFFYQHLFDEKIPETLPMWRVQTKGYKSDEGFAVGLVSHPWGYTDSPDAEYISSGVCAKSPDAVAIGRHGNYLHWGFAASPAYMTEEAKIVFVNAVVYISKFKEAPIARKFNVNIGTRATVKEMKFAASKASFDSKVDYYKFVADEQQRYYDEAKARIDRGEEVPEAQHTFVKNYQPMVLPEMKWEGLKGSVPADLYEKFGEDERAYAKYYDENTPYFYGGEGTMQLVLDEDCRAWGIANNDKRLLDHAITCLEKNQDTERAKRIMHRYTLCDFTNAADWRAWYDKYNDRLFFTESGGWIFMINGPKSLPGNDYTILQRRMEEQRQTSQRTMPRMEETAMEVPTADNPVIVSVTANKVGEGMIDIVVRFNLYKGFHIYKNVSSDDPYIPLSISYDLPDGCTIEGESYAPKPLPLGTTGTTIYEGEVSIHQLVRCKTIPEKIKLTLGYQCCDDHYCMPPQEKEYVINIKQ